MSNFHVLDVQMKNMIFHHCNNRLSVVKDFSWFILFKKKLIKFFKTKLFDISYL